MSLAECIWPIKKQVNPEIPITGMPMLYLKFSNDTDDYMGTVVLTEDELESYGKSNHCSLLCHELFDGMCLNKENEVHLKKWYLHLKNEKQNASA